MSNPDLLGSWRGEDVKVGDVLEALAALRRAERRTATRTSVLNLVVVPNDPAEADRACEAMHALGGRHPGRTIVLFPAEASASSIGLDAEVVLHGEEGSGHSLWSEDVRLWPRGPVRAHLDSLIEPLTLPDLPIAVWYVGLLPDPSDPLLRAADSVVADAKEAGGRRGLEMILALSRRRPLVDLSWIRLQPWRELLAGLFDPPELRPYLGGVTRAKVGGKPGSRDLVAGWLASRLDLGPSAFELCDDRHVSVSLEAVHRGVRGTFAVDRGPGGRTLEARADLEDGYRRQDRLTLADFSLPWSLGEALGQLEGHRPYGRALEAAVGFAS